MQINVSTSSVNPDARCTDILTLMRIKVHVYIYKYVDKSEINAKCFLVSYLEHLDVSIIESLITKQ